MSTAGRKILSIFPSTFEVGEAVMFLTQKKSEPGLGLANVITPTSRRGLTDRAGRMPALFLRIFFEFFAESSMLTVLLLQRKKAPKPAEKARINAFVTFPGQAPGGELWVLARDYAYYEPGSPGQGGCKYRLRAALLCKR